MDKIEPFQEGKPETPFFAEVMNSRIVRPLNEFLKIVATPPLRLVKADSGWFLYDVRAEGAEQFEEGLAIELPSFLVNGTVFSILQISGAVYIAGSFTQVNGQNYRGLARISSSGALTLDAGFASTPGIDSDIAFETGVQSSGKLVVGGSGFNSYNSTSVARIFRVNTDGTLDNTFSAGTGPDGWIYTLKVLSNDKILAGGGFEDFSGTDTSQTANLILLNSNGTVDFAFENASPDSSGPVHKSFVYDLLPLSTGKLLISGSPIYDRDEDTWYFGLWRANSDGTVDYSFAWHEADGNDEVFSLALQSDGKVLAGSLFEPGERIYTSSPFAGIDRFNSDGSIDTSFASPIVNYGRVDGIGILSTGKIIIVGEFNLDGFTGMYGCARLNANGSVDAVIGGTISPGGGAMSVVVESGDSILVGGTFPAVSSSNLVRFNSSGTFVP